jgi:quercetin dioxygenase-like cupin family protein
MKLKVSWTRWGALLYAGCVFAGSGMWLLHAQQQAPNSNFTGKVTTVEEHPQARISRYRFEPGARTKWHVHLGGQLILVEEGVGRHQLKGSPVQELHAGDAIFAPPNTPHWHGAAPDQYAVLYSVARGGIKWMDEVSEKEYTAKPGK